MTLISRKETRKGREEESSNRCEQKTKMNKKNTIVPSYMFVLLPQSKYHSFNQVNNHGE